MFLGGLSLYASTAHLSALSGSSIIRKIMIDERLSVVAENSNVIYDVSTGSSTFRVFLFIAMILYNFIYIERQERRLVSLFLYVFP